MNYKDHKNFKIHKVLKKFKYLIYPLPFTIIIKYRFYNKSKYDTVVKSKAIYMMHSIVHLKSKTCQMRKM